MKSPYTMAPMISTTDGNDLGDDIDQQSMESAQSAAIADNMVPQAWQLLLLGTRIYEGRQDSFKAIDVGIGQARVDQRRGQVEILVSMCRHGS